MIKEYSVKGVKIFDLDLIPDERGFFTEVLRMDWEQFVEEKFAQVNCSLSYPGTVRAWHKHIRGQVDYFFVAKGALKICAFDEKTRKMAEIIATGRKPVLVKVPGHYLHGFKVVGNKLALLIYFVNKLYDYNDPDEVRVPWNDTSIKPAEINGSVKDPRVNQSWDWFYPPFK